MLFDTLYHTFHHPWNQISLASWRKYPNPNRPDVLSVDLINKHFDPATGILTSTRLITTHVRLPSFLESFYSNPIVYCVEESYVDPRNQTMRLVSKNITLSSMMEVEEMCTYTAAQNQTTHFQQDVKIKAHLFGLAGKVENWSLENFRKNALKGRDIMEDAILRLKKDAEEIVDDIVDISIRSVVTRQ
jgi:hypothetical protein